MAHIIIPEPSRSEHMYGWSPPATPDPRNYKLLFEKDEEKAAPPPPAASVEKYLPACWDQSDLGACSAFSSLAAYWQLIAKEFEAKAAGVLAPELMSFLFQYLNTRKILGSQFVDSGATIEAAFKAMKKYGVCPDADWPYIISKFADEPPNKAYLDALNHIVMSYYDIGSSLNNLKRCIADGYGFSFGVTIKSSFEDPHGVAKTGIMKKPGYFERTLGGHAIYAGAYDDHFKTHERKPGAFKIRNSWGPDWGPFHGWFWIPYDVIDSDLCDEFFSPRLAA